MSEVEANKQIEHRTVVWWRWMTLGLVLIAIALLLCIAGLWGDSRWAGTGGIIGLPGLIVTVIASMNLDSLAIEAGRTRRHY